MTQVFSLPFQDRATHPLAGTTVLQLVPDLEDNATSRTAIDIAVALGAAGARALVACAGGRMAGELQTKGGVFVPFPSRARNPFAMALNMRRLARLIVVEGADIVHVRSRALAWVAHGATRMTKTPLVTTFQCGYQSSNPIIKRYNSVLARGDAVLADSQFTAAFAGKLHAAAAGKIRIVHQGVDCQIFAPDMVTPARVQAVRRHWKAAPHEQIVLVTGLSSLASSHKVLFEAAGLLSRSGLAGVKIILDVDGKEGGALDRAIAKAGLQNIVCRAADGDAPAAFLAASIVAVPAAGTQASSRAAIQAQAMGTPVIAANAGAAPEIVLAPPAAGEPSRTGYLVKPGDAAALALAIANVLSFGASASGKISQRARKHVETQFSTAQVCAGTLEAYLALRHGGDQ